MNINFNCKKLCIKCTRDKIHSVLCCYYRGYCEDNEKCTPLYRRICPLRNSQSRENLAKYIELMDYPKLEKYKITKFESCAEKLESRFIPEIRVREAIQKEVKQVLSSFPIIAISLQNFLTNNGRTNTVFSEAKRIGLKKLLDYKGKIIITTDIRDPICEKLLAYPQFFVKIINSLKPDYVTTLDTFYYIDMPTAFVDYQILKVLKILPTLQQIDKDIKIIGLLIGALPYQEIAFIKVLKQMGCQIVAVPSYELRRDNNTKEIRRKVKLLQKFGFSVLLLSSGPGKRKHQRVSADYYSKYWFFARDYLREIQYYAGVYEGSLLKFVM